MKKGYLLKLLLGITIIAILYYKIGFAQIIAALREMSLLWWMPIIILYMLILCLAAFNVKLLSDKVKHVDYPTILKYFMISWSFGLIVPARIGEFSFSLLFKRHGPTPGQGIAVILLDKVISVAVVTVFGMLGLLLFFSAATALSMALSLLVLATISVFLLSRQAIRDFVSTSIFRKYSKHFTGFFKFLHMMVLKHIDIILLNGTLTVVRWMATCTLAFMAFLAFGIQVSFVHVLILNALVTLVSLIPITPHGLGPRETSAVYLFSLVGVPAGVTAAVYLLFAALDYITGALVFLAVKDRISDFQSL
jgi:uncharacterized protein (TIRG00374 family)